MRDQPAIQLVKGLERNNLAISGPSSSRRAPKRAGCFVPAPNLTSPWSRAMLTKMATSKRPALRKQDRVTLSQIKRPIPAYEGKPFVGREDVLTVSHITGTGSKRNPWGVVVTDGTHFWHLEPDDVAPVEAGAAHSAMKRALARMSRNHPSQRTSAQLDREIAEVLARPPSSDIQLKDRYSGSPVTLTVREGRVVGAMGTEPKRYMGMTVDEARHYARHGGRGRSSHATIASSASELLKLRAMHRAKAGGAAPKVTERLPFSTRQCYACDSREAVGVRDRRPEGGMIEAACPRHADPTIPAYPACSLCGGQIRPGSYDVDGTFVHKACHTADCL